MGKRYKGVTVVTPTIRPQHVNWIFENYLRQKYPKKELIIVVNSGRIDFGKLKRKAKKHRKVRVFRVPERFSLGECLNFAVKRAKYRYIAKFDDDDYYGPKYLVEAMRLFRRKKAHIVGKASVYFYFPHRRLLLLRRKSVRPYRRCRRIAGATIMFRKKVFKKVRFQRARMGTDALFVMKCLRKGFRMFTSSNAHFFAYRRPDPDSHTWKIPDHRLLSEKDTRIIHTDTPARIVDRRA